MCSFSFNSEYFLISFFITSLSQRLFKDFIYLRERETAWDWQGRGADSPLSGEPNWGLIPGPWDPDLSWRQMLNQLSHPGTLTQGLFRCVLISLQIFKYFPELFLFLISNLISLWLQNTLLWLSPFDLLLLLQFIFWPKIQFILVNVLWKLEKNGGVQVYILADFLPVEISDYNWEFACFSAILSIFALCILNLLIDV